MSELLVSPALASVMETAILSCYSSVGSNHLPTGVEPPPSLLGDGCFPKLRWLSVSGLRLKWTKTYAFPSLTHLSLRTLPPSSWPTFPQLEVLFKASPCLQSLSLLGVGCNYVPATLAPTPVPSLARLDVSFSTGSPSDAVHLYNVVRGFCFPNLTHLTAAFHVLPSLHAFASSSLLTGCSKLFETMRNVVELDLRGAAAGFLDALVGLQVHAWRPFCPKLAILTVRTGQWSGVRRVLEVRSRQGLPLSTVRYQGLVAETESTIERYVLDDFIYIKTHVENLEWVPVEPIAKLINGISLKGKSRASVEFIFIASVALNRSVFDIRASQFLKFRGDSKGCQSRNSRSN
ncbi:hypothetical protein C8F04DRAFT_1192351 [Mycena alexandri]|uniref:Uncharacterized protein n=1 Tax=Mycena alexandri TaxID=1745969 RepID=A0AAD6SBK6_9AGAR|nr:hypothetical protein C8F04DRAFT_1192351 [Mycena alexandri]